MEKLEIKKSSLINAGNFIVSIGTHTISDVALISKSSGNFVSFKNIKKGGKLSKIKRKFKNKICDDNQFFFSFMSKEDVFNLIKILK